jgi:DNA modification methylase
MMNLNKIYQGDSLTVLQSFPDRVFDLCVTDPPYQFDNKGGGFYADNNSTQRVYLDSLMKTDCCEFVPSDFLDILKPKMKLFYGYFFCNKTLITQYIQWAIGNGYKYDVLVMAKSNPIPAYNNHHLSDLEYIILIREDGTVLYKTKNIDDYRKFYLTNCERNLEHPAKKPDNLIGRFINISSKENDLIIDPFIGSGTTGYVAGLLNRKFVGIELNPEYVKIANNRIDENRTMFDENN